MKIEPKYKLKPMYHKMTLEQIHNIYTSEYKVSDIVEILRLKMDVFYYLDYDKDETYYILSSEQIEELQEKLKTINNTVKSISD